MTSFPTQDRPTVSKTVPIRLWQAGVEGNAERRREGTVGEELCRRGYRNVVDIAPPDTV